MIDSEAGPTLKKIIDQAIDAKLTDMNIGMPARVEAVDVAAGKCDVQPAIMTKSRLGVVKNLPIIPNVPIASYRAGKAFISLPVKVGDYVELRFSQRSLDLWLVNGGIIDPKDPRKFALSDAIAYPGVYPFSEPPTGATADDIIIKNDQSKVTIKPDGKFLFSGQVEELMNLLVQTLNLLSDTNNLISQTTVNTVFGPMKVNDFAVFAVYKTMADTIRGKIESIKG